MKEDKDIYRDNPTKNDMMHVVVFVLRCDKTFNCEQQVADIQELLDPLGKLDTVPTYSKRTTCSWVHYMGSLHGSIAHLERTWKASAKFKFKIN